MASSTASLHILSLPSSKPLSPPSNTIFPTSSLVISPLSKHFTITTSSKLFESTPLLPRVALSLDLGFDDDLSSAGDEELETSFSPEFKLFVGNLPFNVDSAALARLFKRSGSVEMAEVVYDKLSRRSRGFGFVAMSSIEEAEAAAKKFDGYELEGRRLKVNYGPPPIKKSFIRGLRDGGNREGGTRDGNTNTVYVGNLSWSVDNQALETLFWEHGNVMKAKVFYDKDSGRSRGFGFVTYSSADEVCSAVESLDGVDLDGRNIQVSVAVPPHRR